MPRCFVGLTLAAALFLGGCCGAPRDETPATTASDPPVAAITASEATEGDPIVYDIRDLFAPTYNFDAPPFDPTGRDPQPALIQPQADRESDVTRAEFAEQIKMLITETVGTLEHWEDGHGTAREFNGKLLVKTNAENHAEIERLLTSLREMPRKVIFTEARLLVIPETRLGELLAEAKLPAINLDAPQTQTVGLIDEAGSRLLADATLADRQGITHTSPRIALYDGQTAFATNHKQLAYVSDAEPATGEGNESGVDITVSAAQSGTTLIVRGVLGDEESRLSVELEPRLSNVASPPFPVVRTVTSLDGTGTATVEAPRVWSWRNVARFDDLPSGSTVMFIGDRLVGPAPELLSEDADAVPADLARRPVVLVKLGVVKHHPSEDQLFPGLTEQLSRSSETALTE